MELVLRSVGLAPALFQHIARMHEKIQHRFPGACPSHDWIEGSAYGATTLATRRTGDGGTQALADARLMGRRGALALPKGASGGVAGAW